MFTNNVLEVNTKFATQSKWPGHTDLRKKTMNFSIQNWTSLYWYSQQLGGRGYDILPADML